MALAQYAGRLIGGTQLPIDGPDWVTWDPVTDSSPNLPGRLYGNERTIRAILSVVAGHCDAHPHAPRVVVGDISFRDDHENHMHVGFPVPRGPEPERAERERRADAPGKNRTCARGLGNRCSIH
jgi:hypothetical protein